ncbi:MAG: LacI family DNA-binding transcriptional regulator [Bacillota bacterium]|uniref:Transcriptional regulator, LacI family n=2 Tax=Carboxydocella TaxID=178898 RepID=A0A1T4R8I3_9FIRM|nr:MULTISPECIES: LacI family DNA-binding transcriptional regulator [Carboxydocella]AVX19726.1 transcriptional regulator, LacI family [Carboxydocella thermautotrophica]AVX30137.1 transcriptional regulator, LacI family [Carboxydocella thermautotrophica]SKA12227.1 transcriptional regulator, LacI family [Carboxydocella sporoproducens DSM 16521]GAW29788.1 LacI family transcriptional regulator [Carboxydocella sp. ULO1]GAW31361.1 LacI family transcriptional regulator [Carboxydocella sp. JDF658]
MAPTIKDVAKLAGVNPSTVSRVLANNPKISEETRQRVLQAMKELGYHPNLVARNLVTRSTETIGLVMPRAAEEVFLNPFFPEVIRGISSVARREGYDLLLATGETEQEEKEAVLRMVRGRRVDGVILLVSRVDNQLGAELQARKFPAALVGKPLHDWDMCWVDNDNIEAAYQATAYLLGLGHRRIGCIIGSLEFVVSLDRLDGYKKALQEFGVGFDRSLVAHGEYTQEGGERAMLELLDRHPDLTAVVVADDLMAFGAIQAVRERGMKVPRDVSVVGFNNVPMARFTAPPLTSVEIFTYELGVRVTELLIEKIRNPARKAGHDFIRTELVIRKSCAPAKEAKN